MKLLLIGWDAADKSLIEPLLERGLMPCLELFYSRAVVRELQPVRPLDSAALWTSIVTGKRATSHGVLGAVEADPSQTSIRPVWRWSRTAPALWSILSKAGFRTHAIGWPASHPAEPTGGVSISDLFAENGDADSIHPQQLFDTLLALRLSPTEIDAASILALLPRAAELDPADRRLYEVARFLASTGSLHAATTWALEHEPWDFAAVRYAGLGRLVQVFGPAYMSAEAGEQSKEAALFGGVIPNAYRFYDILLARLVELVGPDTSVMLVSEQGGTRQPSLAEPDRSRPKPGVLIAAGSSFKSGLQLPAASVCDIAPTIIRLFGLSPETGIHGRALRDMLSMAANATACADEPPGELNGAPGGEPEVIRGPESQSRPPDGDSVADAFSQGARDQPNEPLRCAIEQLNQQREWRLAEAWMDSREYGRAAEILEGLVNTKPKSIPYRSALAEAYFRAGKYEACRRTILALQADGTATPLSEIGLAAMEVEKGHSAEAGEHLRRAEAMGGASASLLEIMGRLYLRLRRSADAVRLLDAAIARDPALATAHDGRAIASLLGGDFLGAERHAREAVELSPQYYDAQYHLGLALARQDRTDEAIDALKAAVSLDREGGPSAHRRLAELLERRGDHAFALHHRALSYRRDRITRRPWLDADWFCENSAE